MKNILTKLLEVQKEIGAIKKENENPFFKSRYFDINALLAVVKPVLNKHGLLLTQGLVAVEGRNGLNTAIVEVETGEKVEYTCLLPEAVKAQDAGSAITYFRRYAIQSLLALEAEDDDANKASERAGEKVVDYDKPPFEEKIKTNFKI